MANHPNRTATKTKPTQAATPRSVSERALATRDQVPEHLRGALARSEEFDGRGVSRDQDDSIIPLIYIIQSNSPQLDRQDRARYVDGAQAGSVWLRGSPEPMVDSEDGIEFQPCAFLKDWVEWIPRDNGGGFVQRHEMRSGEKRDDFLGRMKAEKVVDPKNPRRQRWVLPNKNELVETRYHYGFANDEPYVIPMTSTGHTVSRQWTAAMKRQRLPNGKMADCWLHTYKLTTVQRQNASGKWFTWKIEDLGWVKTAEEDARGLAMFEAVTGGAVRAAVPEETGDRDGDGDEGGDNDAGGRV